MKGNGEWDGLRRRSVRWSVAEVQTLLHCKLIGQQSSESVLHSRSTDEIESQWRRILPLILHSGNNKERSLRPSHPDHETYASHARSVSESSVPLRQPWPVRSAESPANLASWDIYLECGGRDVS